MTVFTVRYVFIPSAAHVAAISRRSSTVNVLAECALMLSRPMPKYTEPAPACIAACRLSRLPTGAMISKSLIVSFIIWERYENWENRESRENTALPILSILPVLPVMLSNEQQFAVLWQRPQLVGHDKLELVYLVAYFSHLGFYRVVVGYSLLAFALNLVRHLARVD